MLLIVSGVTANAPLAHIWMYKCLQAFRENSQVRDQLLEAYSTCLVEGHYGAMAPSPDVWERG